VPLLLPINISPAKGDCQPSEAGGYANELLMLLNVAFTAVDMPLIEEIRTRLIKHNSSAYSTKSWPSSPIRRATNFMHSF